MRGKRIKCSRVGLEDYTVYGKHGAYQAEHAYEQPFIVSIWVELAPEPI